MVKTMRFILLTLGVVSLAACTPQVPDSGVGFGDYETYQAERGTATALGSPDAPTLGEPVAGTAPQQAATNNAGISDEQDFGAVSGRESIESDAARIEANRERYVIVEPTELPVRSGSSQSLIVEYALATTNSVGEPLYSRSKVFAETKFNRNCAKFTSPDLAQEAFLNRGGPKRDPKGIDPDGDGFACYWDPNPYRQARLAAQAVAPVGPPAE